MLPKVSTFARLQGGRICRIDGGPLGSRYTLSVEITDFRGLQGWRSDFTLAALAESFEEVVPENRDVVHWLQHLGTCELKVTKDAAGTALLCFETEIDGVGIMRLPPEGSFAEVNGMDAGELSNSIGIQLFELAGVRASSAAMATHTSGGTNLQGDRAGTAPSNAAVRSAADAAASSPVAQQTKSAAGAEAEIPHESDDDVAPVPRTKRVKSRGRGRGFRL